MLRSVHYRDQDNVNFQLKERLRLVQSWKCDLQQELNYNKKESACLEEKIRQLEHALKETYRPLQTALDCQKHRSGQVGDDHPDLVNGIKQTG